VIRALGRLLGRILLIILAFVAGLIGLYRFVDPPVTPLMLIRLAQGDGMRHTSRPLERIDRDLPLAVIASEDNRFCRHAGVDWSAVGDALEDFDERGRVRGASTITMQVARNLFLWPGGGFVRKAVELPLAYAVDLAWPKRRIIEVYLNIAEWGPGTFGAEAAAQHHFGKSAAQLSRREAALLAAILPSPRHWPAGRPSAYIDRRAGIIAARIDRLGGWFDCLR
jgi:monofunctional biosynthetic peptidoglycan transglycosylase